MGMKRLAHNRTTTPFAFAGAVAYSLACLTMRRMSKARVDPSHHLHGFSEHVELPIFGGSQVRPQRAEVLTTNRSARSTEEVSLSGGHQWRRRQLVRCVHKWRVRLLLLPRGHPRGGSVTRRRAVVGVNSTTPSLLKGQRRCAGSRNGAVLAALESVDAVVRSTRNSAELSALEARVLLKGAITRGTFWRRRLIAPLWPCHRAIHPVTRPPARSSDATWRFSDPNDRRTARCAGRA